MPNHQHDHPVGEREPFGNVTVNEFLEALAARQSTPGGGAASALVGANAAGLVGMVAHFTLGKKGFEEVAERIGYIQERADAARQALVFAMDDDANVFEALMTAYAVPRPPDNPQAMAARQATINARLRDATNVPRMIARTCAEIADMGVELLRIGNPSTISDAAGAVLLAAATVETVLYNGQINLASLLKNPSDADRTFLDEARAEMSALTARARAAATTANETMRQRFG